MLITRIVQIILAAGALALIAYALQTVTLDRRTRTYRVVADGEALYTGLHKEDAEWDAHDAERSGLYHTVKVERE